MIPINTTSKIAVLAECMARLKPGLAYTSQQIADLSGVHRFIVTTYVGQAKKGGLISSHTELAPNPGKPGWRMSLLKWEWKEPFTAKQFILAARRGHRKQDARRAWKSKSKRRRSMRSQSMASVNREIDQHLDTLADKTRDPLVLKLSKRAQEYEAKARTIREAIELLHDV